MRCGFQEIRFRVRFTMQASHVLIAIHSFYLSLVAVCRGIVSHHENYSFRTVTGVGLTSGYTNIILNFV